MKKILLFLCTLALMFGLVGNAWAIQYNGSIDSCDGMVATGSWGCYDPGNQEPPLAGTQLAWQVDDFTNSGLWTYNYTFTVYGKEGIAKEISHVIIEVSDTFTKDNIYPGTTSGYEQEDPKTNTENNGNPGIPQDLFGIRWELPSSLEWYWQIVTDRSPMWGDFYANDGTEGAEAQDKIDIYAYNASFGGTSDAPWNENPYGFVLVPDTTTVPEPATMILLGSGFIGLFGLRRKFRKKQ